MKPDPKCILDVRHFCNGCVADGPATCPYVYLLAARDGRPPEPDDDAEPAQAC